MENRESYYKMQSTGLTIEETKKINTVFSRHSEIEKVLIYGSRAMGNFKPASDIDLTLIGTEIDLSLQLKIEFELDDLMLPYKFDLSIFNKITNSEFIDHIKRVGKDFYAK